MTEYSKLPVNLQRQLSNIEPSLVFGAKYYPCSVRTQKAQLLECVYFVEATSYFSYWGVWPEDDRMKRSISLSNVAFIASSNKRLPVKFAAQIYQAGESGMGYHTFSVNFRDGTKQSYTGGGNIDFIDYPNGLTGADIVSINAGVPSGSTPIQSPDYYWCLYSA